MKVHKSDPMHCVLEKERIQLLITSGNSFPGISTLPPLLLDVRLALLLSAMNTGMSVDWHGFIIA